MRSRFAEVSAGRAGPPPVCRSIDWSQWAKTSPHQIFTGSGTPSRPVMVGVHEEVFRADGQLASYYRTNSRAKKMGRGFGQSSVSTFRVPILPICCWRKLGALTTGDSGHRAALCWIQDKHAAFGWHSRHVRSWAGGGGKSRRSGHATQGTLSSWHCMSRFLRVLGTSRRMRRDRREFPSSSD